MVFFKSLLTLASLLAFASTSPISLNFGDGVTKRADPAMGAYLGAFFLGADPYVYFYLSNGNSPTSFTALNKGQPVLRPTKGTRGVRDPYLVKGGGAEEGKKWYIIGTDLDIGKTSWDAAQRQGSRGIFVWETEDLTNWSQDRLVVVESAEAGMVWAPEAIWDPKEGNFTILDRFSPSQPASYKRLTPPQANILSTGLPRRTRLPTLNTAETPARPRSATPTRRTSRPSPPPKPTSPRPRPTSSTSPSCRLRRPTQTLRRSSAS